MPGDWSRPLRRSRLHFGELVRFGRVGRHGRNDSAGTVLKLDRDNGNRSSNVVLHRSGDRTVVAIDKVVIRTLLTRLEGDTNKILHSFVGNAAVGVVAAVVVVADIERIRLKVYLFATASRRHP